MTELTETDLIIEDLILEIRGQKVMLDVDLAKLYGTTTKALNQAVKRNFERFPLDFMFKLTKEEKLEVVTNCDHLLKIKYSHQKPRVFTEHGVLMLASVLNSDIAIRTSIAIVRVFTKMKTILVEHQELYNKVTALEAKLAHHDQQIHDILNTIKKLILYDEEKSNNKVGFQL